jgi:large subunit ribosomal protein L16
MLFPKKVKHRKWQTFRRNPARITADTRGLEVNFGSYGLKATSHARMKSNQIEAARRVISRTLGKSGRLWVRIFPDRPYTKKAAEVPMGKGKGEPEGRVLFEVDGVSEAVAKEAFRKATAKLPVKSKCVAREG